MNLLTSFCRKANNSATMVGLNLRRALQEFSISHHRIECKCLIKFNNKVILKIIGYATAVFGRIPDDLVLGRDHLDKGPLVKSINNNKCTITMGESQPEYGGAGCRA